MRTPLCPSGTSPACAGASSPAERGERGKDLRNGLSTRGQAPRSGERDLAAAGCVGEDVGGVEFLFAMLLEEGLGLFEEVVGERLVRVVSDVFF